MESSIHLRKGRTLKRLQADLDGLKDDELGRGGFTGRTANKGADRLRAVYGKGGRGSRRMRQGRQGSPRLLQGGAGGLERRRLAVGVLPTAGPTPDGHGQPIGGRPGPDEASAATAHPPSGWTRRSSTSRTRPSAIPSWICTTDESPRGSRRKLAELDPTVDPNERTPGTCYLGDPRVVNNSPIGLARFCTHRLYEIPGANDYFSGPDQRDTLRRAVGICTDWLHRHGFSL